MSDAEQHLRTVLEKISVELDYKDCDVKLESFSTGGANYTSQLYHITLSAPNKDDVKLFAKEACISEQMRAKSPFKIFDTERIFYTEILKRYQDLEERHDVPKQHRLATVKFYGCCQEYLKEVVVLEDLTPIGYETHDRFKTFDWEYASKSVVELAKLHALSVAFNKEYPEEFDDISKKFAMSLDVEDLKPFIDGVSGKALAIIKEENKGRVEAFLQKSQNYDFNDFFKPYRMAVITHGDFRPSNLMHRYLEGGEMEVVPLDYQMMQVSNPIADLMYFIFSGSDEDFRQKYYHNLLDHYHKELCSALTRLGIDAHKMYPKEDFEFELKEIQPYGLLIGIMMLPMVTVDAENAPSMNDGDMADFVIKPNELASCRMNGIVNDFIKLGVL